MWLLGGGVGIGVGVGEGVGDGVGSGVGVGWKPRGIGVGAGVAVGSGVGHGSASARTCSVNPLASWACINFPKYVFGKRVSSI